MAVLIIRSSAVAADTTPDAFTFTDQTGVALSSTITSAAITVSGITAAATISVSGGSYDINGSGSFTTSSGTVNNGDTVRARVTSSGSNSTAVTATVTIGGVSDGFSATTLAGSGSGVFFNPNIGLLANGNTLVSSGTLVDVNRASGGDAEVQSTVTRPGGQSKCVLVTYTQDESQATLKPPAFTLTPTLFTRKHEMYTGGWEGNWPVGLKTSRFFSQPTWTSVDDAYMSEKFIWQRYGVDGGDPDALYVWGLNHALGNNDRVVQYSPSTLFANGLPYLREGYWYKFETWMVMDSAVDAGDGILQCWIDDQIVIDQVVSWRSTANGSGNPSGPAGFQSMWFGGNISSATNGYPTGVTLNRYIDSMYLSTTLDR